MSLVVGSIFKREDSDSLTDTKYCPFLAIQAAVAAEQLKEFNTIIYIVVTLSYNTNPIYNIKLLNYKLFLFRSQGVRETSYA
jgi:hypothetical protein